MTKLYRLTSFVGLFLTLISCSENFNEENDLVSDPDVSKAKTWFKLNVENVSPNQSSNGRVAFKSKKLAWDDGIAYTKDGRTFVEVPLSYESNLIGRPDGYQSCKNYKNLTKLLLIKKDDGYNIFIMRIMPDLNSLGSLESNTYQNKTNAFTGEIIYSDWTDRPLVFVKYQNGIRLERYFFNIVKENSSNGRTQSYVCDFVTVHWYQTACSAYGCTESYLGSDTYYVCVQYNQDQSLDPGDGDLGGGDGYGSGGGIDINDIDLTELWENEKIDDQNLRPCMQSIVADLKNITQGSVGQIIQKFSGSTPGWNWELKDGALTGGTGQTNPPALYNRTTGTVTTTFDSQAWLNATDLSWARTILHESVHAYLTVFFATDQQNFIRTYSQMVQDWGTLQNWDAVHHEEFARSLVTAIADALQTYGLSKGYSLSRQFYEDMSWAGLQGTSTFQNLPATDQARILDTIAIELTGMDTSGNTGTQKGSNAGC